MQTITKLSNNPFDVMRATGGAVFRTDNNGIFAIHYENWLNQLKEQPEYQIEAREFVKFINAMPNNKGYAANGIGKLQYFLNAAIQEQAIVNENANLLKFDSDDHDFLLGNYTGTNDSDISLISNPRCKIELKLFGSLETFIKMRRKTNFHCAHYVFVYFLNSQCWQVYKKEDAWNKPYFINQLYDSDPNLRGIKLPKNFEFIRFYTDEVDSHNFLRLTDKQLPEKVKYEFFSR